MGALYGIAPGSKFIAQLKASLDLNLRVWNLPTLGTPNLPGTWENLVT